MNLGPDGFNTFNNTVLSSPDVEYKNSRTRKHSSEFFTEFITISESQAFILEEFGKLAA
jgi:hypothetical protein